MNEWRKERVFPSRSLNPIEDEEEKKQTLNNDEDKAEKENECLIRIKNSS